jgi:hypothetical protein
MGNAYKKSSQSELFLWILWSEYKDSNLGPPGPKPGALPDCATLRLVDDYSLKIGAFPAGARILRELF